MFANIFKITLLFFCGSLGAQTIHLTQPVRIRSSDDDPVSHMEASYRLVESQAIDKVLTLYARLSSPPRIGDDASIKEPNILKIVRILDGDPSSFSLGLYIQDQTAHKSEHYVDLRYNPNALSSCRIHGSVFSCSFKVKNVDTEIAMPVSILQYVETYRDDILYVVKPSFLDSNKSKCLAITVKKKTSLVTQELPLSECDAMGLPRDGSQFKADIVVVSAGPRKTCYESYNRYDKNFVYNSLLFLTFDDNFDVTGLKSGFYVKSEGVTPKICRQL